MAELALASVIRKTVDILGNLLVDEAARLYWVKEDIRWIKREMRRMQSFLRDLDAKQSSIHGVANLARDVRDLAYDADDIIDTYLPNLLSKNRNFLGWLTKKVNCLPCGIRHHFVMEIEGIRKRVDDINRCKTTYGINENSASGGGEKWNPRQSFPHVDVPIVIGFQEHINALEARLLDTEIQFCVTSIIGMPGVGKTTLAKKVYNSVKAKFQCSAWVYVSQEPKLRDLLQDIARQVGLEKELREENLEANLFNFLKEKRYVIVIDDIWDVKAWDALKNGIPNICENQSRLVLTSRNRDVGLSIGGSSSLHELQPLNSEMSWELCSLFVKTPIENTGQELMHLGKQILKKCGGLPLSIVTIAGLLSTKGVTERAWRGVLNKMGEEKDEICALSYRDLPTELKPCFLYFGERLTEIGNLNHLRYLRLRGADLSLPATMGNLKNLQVLDCQYCLDLILPTAIFKMDKLRHVYIPIDTCVEDQPKFRHKISQVQVVEEVSLPNLQTLYYINLGVIAADILNANCFFQLTNLKNLGVIGSMKQLADILTNTTPISEKLEKFHLFIFDFHGPYDYDLPALNFSCYQNLLNLDFRGPLRKMPLFSRSLTKLNLVGTKLENDPMKELGMLPSLRVLKLRGNSYKGKVMVTSGPNSFPSLEILKIESMPFSKELRVEDGDGVMPKLQKVRIKHKS